MNLVSSFPILNAPSVKDSKKAEFNKTIFSEFITKTKNNEVATVLVKPKTETIYYIEQNGQYNSTYYSDSNEFWRIVLNSEANINIDNSSEFSLNDALSSVFSFFLIVTLIRFLFFQLNGGQQTNPFSKSKTMQIEQHITTRFSDVEGIDDAKEELEEIVDFLRNPEKYSKSGAKIPKGALLIGSPGTGKTLLARAIAGESSVPFIQCSGSSFIEMFVGVGAKRVREIFENARKSQPCIIFIDEIDAIGKKRSSNGFPSNDEREQTINQLLTEMDGFENQSKIVVIAATNRADILDDALLRPGRFDRKIQVKLPDVRGRLKILQVHSKNKNFKIDDNISLKDVAKQTIGFTGADLENLVNECAIRAVKISDDGLITADIIEETYQRIVVGAKGNNLMSIDTKTRIAYHEAGHAIIGAIMPDYELVRKVSIVPRGNAGGITFFQPQNDDMKMHTKEFFLSQIKVALAGHAAEEIIYGKNHISTGASSDFSRVFLLAKEMVTTYGFGNTIGKINAPNSELSQQTLYNIDIEIKAIVDKCYSQTLALLQTYYSQLDTLKNVLIDEEIVDGHFVYSLFK